MWVAHKQDIDTQGEAGREVFKQLHKTHYKERTITHAGESKIKKEQKKSTTMLQSN
jgi:hypothetical protein